MATTMHADSGALLAVSNQCNQVSNRQHTGSSSSTSSSSSGGSSVDTTPVTARFSSVSLSSSMEDGLDIALTTGTSGSSNSTCGGGGGGGGGVVGTAGVPKTYHLDYSLASVTAMSSQNADAMATQLPGVSSSGEENRHRALVRSLPGNEPTPVSNGGHHDGSLNSNGSFSPQAATSSKSTTLASNTLASNTMVSNMIIENELVHQPLAVSKHIGSVSGGVGVGGGGSGSGGDGGSGGSGGGSVVSRVSPLQAVQDVVPVPLDAVDAGTEHARTHSQSESGMLIQQSSSSPAQPSSTATATATATATGAAAVAVEVEAAAAASIQQQEGSQHLHLHHHQAVAHAFSDSTTLPSHRTVATRTASDSTIPSAATAQQHTVVTRSGSRGNSSRGGGFRRRLSRTLSVFSSSAPPYTETTATATTPTRKPASRTASSSSSILEQERMEEQEYGDHLPLQSQSSARSLSTPFKTPTMPSRASDAANYTTISSSSGNTNRSGQFVTRLRRSLSMGSRPGRHGNGAPSPSHDTSTPTGGSRGNAGHRAVASTSSTPSRWSRQRRRQVSSVSSATSVSPTLPLSPFGADKTYRRIAIIGEGSYATVYRGHSSRLGMVVALKEITLNPEEGTPFTAIREASLLKGLKHANIIVLHDIIHTTSKLTFVFEYVDTDLSHYMEAYAHGMPRQDVRLFLFQLLRGLQYVHARRILHRDLKPQNLLINRNGELKLADFGLARAKSVPSHTYSHEVVTVWYRPPDVLLGSVDYTSSIDLWGVGCIFLEMLCGAPVFPGMNDVHDQLMKIFKVLGTPTEMTWPGVTRLSHYQGNYGDSKRTKLRFVVAEVSQSQGAEHLADWLLRLNPAERLSAHDALNHPYFACIPSDVKLLPCGRSIYSNGMLEFSGGSKAAFAHADKADSLSLLSGGTPEKDTAAGASTGHAAAS